MLLYKEASFVGRLAFPLSKRPAEAGKTDEVLTVRLQAFVFFIPAEEHTLISLL